MSSIAEKIRQLIAKASSTDNTHESEAFYAKAHELMVKYNIEENTLTEPSDLVRGEQRFDGSSKWVWILSASASCLIGVNILVNPKDGLSYFAGRPMNVKMAEELFDHYVEQVNRYYKMALPKGLSKSGRGVFRSNFREGAAQVIFHRVCEIISANSRALIVSPLQLDEEIEKLTGQKQPRKTKDLVIKHDSVGTHAGRIAGHLVELGKTIDG